LRFSRASVGPRSHARLEPGTSRLVRAGLLTRPSYAADGLPFPGRRCVTWRPSVGRAAGSGDPRRTKRRAAGSGDPCRTKRRTAGSGERRRTIQICNESSRDQRAVKTNFAACHSRTDYSRQHILSMHGENATSGPSASQSIYLDSQIFLRLRDASRVPRFRGLNSWVLHLAETDLEGRGRAAIIRRRLNLIAKPQLVGLQCPGDDFRGSPVEPIWPRD